MPDLDEIQSLGEQLLTQTSQPAPRVRLLWEGLRVSPDDRRLLETRQVQELAESQLPDGSWGRFHTQDTKIKRRFRTTEEAVSRTLALRLGRQLPSLRSPQV